MQKLSRVNKYRDYRNELNNSGEREIVTQELKELQEKIILNEKRFGASSKTEFDLNRGRRSTSFDAYSISLKPKDDNPQDYLEDKVSNSDGLDDIFSELNKYKTPSSFSSKNEEQDDYIKRIKEIVSKAGMQHNEPSESQEIVSNHERLLSDTASKEEAKPIEELVKEEYESIEKPDFAKTESSEEQKPYIIEPQDTFAEFEESKPEPVQVECESQLDDVVLEKPVIKQIVPQVDHSKEFKEICENVNSLAEEIEESSSFAQLQYIPQPKTRMPETSLEGMQQTINKDLMNSDDSFMESLKQEVEQYNKAEEAKKTEIGKKENTEDQKKENKKNEMNGQMKQEYDNTISLEVNKLLNEINSSKADHISTDDIISEYESNNKETINDQSGKTIAFEIEKNEIPDNTIVLTKPDLDDSSIHTMSFQTEDLDIEEEKSNVLLNIILGVLILIAVAALAVIVYFILITRGIL